MMRLKATLSWTTIVPLVALLAACSGTSEDDDSLATGDTGNTDTQTGDVGIDVTVEVGPTCGDGTVDAGEECDGTAGDATCSDIDGISGDVTCAADCTLDYSACVTATCGDGSINGDDECDGDEFGGTTCGDFSFAYGELACGDDCTVDTSSCRSVAECGDGFPEGTEECDDGNLTDGDGCASDCISETCGDGIVQPGLDEACDSGSVIITECEDDPERPVGYITCNADCELEETLCPVPATCGDGIIDVGEACDDNNAIDDDECNNACESNVCGDGALSASEACDGDEVPTSCADLGFSAGSTACSETCELTYDSCRNVTCGDGFIDGAETCDDGNLESGDGCSRRCQLESCGDGVAIDGVEACDGDDLQDLACGDFDMMGDALACDATCQFDTSECEEIPCGNGTVSDDEECDDGNRDDGDGCSATCEVECLTDDIEDIVLDEFGTIMTDLVAHGGDTFAFVGCDDGYAQAHIIADTDDLDVTIVETGVAIPVATTTPYERNGMWHYELGVAALNAGTDYALQVEPGEPVCASYDVVFNRTCDTNCDGVDNEDADDSFATAPEYGLDLEPAGGEVYMNDIEHMSATVSPLGDGGVDVYLGSIAVDSSLLAWVNGERIEIAGFDGFSSYSTNFTDIPETTDIILVPGSDSCTPYNVYGYFSECAADEGSDFPPSFPVNGGTMTTIIGSGYTIGVDMCEGGTGTFNATSPGGTLTADIYVGADDEFYEAQALPADFSVTNSGTVEFSVINPVSCALADLTLVTSCPCVDDGDGNNAFADATPADGSYIFPSGIALVGTDGVPVVDYYQVHDPNSGQSGSCDAETLVSFYSYGAADGIVLQLLDDTGVNVGEPFSIDGYMTFTLDNPDVAHFVSIAGTSTDTCLPYDLEVSSYCDFGIDG